MRYLVQWIDHVGYYTYIEANSPKEAERKFWDGWGSAPEPDGLVDTDEETVVIKEAPE